MSQEKESSNVGDNQTEYNEKTIKKCFCLTKRPPWQKMNKRRINLAEPNTEIPDNAIHTGKYNIFNFLPKNLLWQFAKLANFYFLIVGILQIVPEISNTGGQPLIYLPLILVVFLSMLKDGFEDYKRHKSDGFENRSKTIWLNGNSFEPTTWERLRVGNIIKVTKNQYFPADVMILYTSETNGVCFIETKNLDGETNLKQKCANNDLYKQYRSNSKDLETEFAKRKYLFTYESPNPYLYTFNGNIKLSDDENESPASLDNNNFILRGSSLRNTEYVYGVVSFTGHDTKIMLNSVSGKAKHSRVEVVTNNQILIIFIFQILLSILCSILYALYKSLKEELVYLEIGKNSNDDKFSYYFGIEIASWFLLFTNFVPISLLVTLEMVKFFQAYLISKDTNLRSAEGVSASVQSSNLNEELGQIHYIFSDKTGTLTCNIMEFKKFCVAGETYGSEGANQKEKKIVEGITNVDFYDKRFMDILNDKKHPQYAGIHEALICLALCHSIITEKGKGEEELIYNASAPDELALVNFAKYCGYEYRGKDNENNMILRIQDEIHTYKLFYTLEFNSTRKRMSVIIEDKNKNIIMYCKGADSIILNRINKNHPNIPTTWKNLEKYALIGLRTLVLAKRPLTKQEFLTWSEKYKAASSAIENREFKMDVLQSEIETGMELVGATAIEDKLQDDVGGTIATLKETGIKVWVLTGDKIETAVNIGYSCKLLADGMEIIYVDGTERDSVSNALDQALKKLSDENRQQVDAAMVISGDALIWGIEEKQLSQKIVDIGDRCRVVLACRVSPKQKQEVVSLIRKAKKDSVTLAIGDGANDVNMITAAHVGVGIRGLEGQQAARASDYAIGEFKMLRRLLLYVGRESYRKNTTLIGYNFYKNFLLGFPFFWNGIFSFWSGQQIYDSWIYQFFNLLYASAPIIVYALLDEEFPADNELEIFKTKPSELEKKPLLYDIGFESKLFNTKQFWLWIFSGVSHACALTFYSFYSFERNFIGYKQAYSADVWNSGMMIFTLCVIVANLKVIRFSNTHSSISIFFLVASVAVYFATFGAGSLIKYLESFNVFVMSFENAAFYIGTFVVIVITYYFDIAWSNYKYFSRNSNNKVSSLTLKDPVKSKSPDISHEQDMENSPFTNKNETERKEEYYKDGEQSEEDIYDQGEDKNIKSGQVKVKSGGKRK